MTIPRITRLSSKTLNGIALIIVITLPSGCAMNTAANNVLANSTQGIIKTSDRNSRHEDMFELSVQAQRAYNESRWIDSVRLYQQIVEHVPNDSVTWFRLANTYAQQGAFERAIHAYEQSLALDKEQPKAWFNLSTAYLLNAKSAMIHAHNGLRDHDPAKTMIESRLQALSHLVNDRLEEIYNRQVRIAH